MRTIVEAARVVGIQPTMCDYDSLRGVIGDKEERRGEKRERERRATKHGEKTRLAIAAVAGSNRAILEQQ
jgi:hypothetical protein